MKTAGLRLIPFFAAVAFSASAHATLIDFNSLEGADHDYYSDFLDTVSTNGYLFESKDLVSWQASSSLLDVDGNYTGSTSLFSNYREEPVTLSKVGGGSFNLVSMDIANLFGAAASPFSATNSTVVFTGYFASGGSIVQSYTTATDDLLHTVNFTGFNNLSSVSWVQNGIPFHQFDNVVVTPQAVPEPATFAAFGMGALALLKRRRR